ncbi:MAG: transglycosylase domain-containing protein [Flavobacteriaceae bacterium]
MLLRFLGFLFTAAVILFLVGAGVVTYVVWDYSRNLPDYQALKEYSPPVMTRVHAADGSLVAEYAKQRRLYLPIQAVPERVIHAFMSAEDKNFYSHFGIDPMGIARAAVKYVSSGGRVMQGASTITQQVAKNFLLTNERSFERKIKEAILSLRIERTFSKDQILELYLNEIFLGLNSYGVAAASLIYFGKSVHELTIDEAAYLAAAQGAQQLSPVPPHRARHRTAQLGDRPDAGERLRHGGGGRGGQGPSARRLAAPVRRAAVCRGLFRRGSPPRDLRPLWREGTLRRRAVDPHLARSADAGRGAARADPRPDRI